MQKGIIKMQEDSFEESCHLLPLNLLDGTRMVHVEDDVPTTTSKRDSWETHSAVFSAPPALYDIGYQIEDELLGGGSADPEKGKHSWPVTTFRSYRDLGIDLYESPPVAVRKMSLQDQSYGRSPTHPCASLCAEEELLSRLEDACRWARDQNGSRTVQSLLEKGSEPTKAAIFTYISKEAPELIKDRFGNYIFQKIFEQGLPYHQAQLFALVLNRILELSQNCYGCRVVQKALEYTADKPREQTLIIAQLTPLALRLIQNQNGNHVMQKCCEIIDLQLLNDIVDKILANVNPFHTQIGKLSFHAFGCRVIQKYLQKSGQHPKQTIILNRLLEMARQLSQCQYGNYVMQHIVKNCKQHLDTILNIFLKHFVTLSCNKYASNVIQKALEAGKQLFCDSVAEMLLQADKQNSHPTQSYRGQQKSVRKLRDSKSIRKTEPAKEGTNPSQTQGIRERNQQISIWEARAHSARQVQMTPASCQCVQLQFAPILAVESGQHSALKPSVWLSLINLAREEGKANPHIQECRSIGEGEEWG